MTFVEISIFVILFIYLFCRFKDQCYSVVECDPDAEVVQFDTENGITKYAKYFFTEYFHIIFACRCVDFLSIRQLIDVSADCSSGDAADQEV